MAENMSNALGETLALLVEGKKYTAARDVLETMHAADIAAMLEECRAEVVPLLFRLLPKELAADTFVEMGEDQQEILITSFSDSELKEVVDELYVDDAVDIVEEMPANVVRRILRQADPEKRKMINEILKYPEDSAGSIMTTEYVSLRPAMTVEDAIKRIRRTGIDKETINTCYVTSDNRKLLGIVTVRALLLADENATMEEIMTEDVISALTTEDREEVAHNFTKYDLSAMPVVDVENRLVGIVTVDDVMDEVREQSERDYQLASGISQDIESTDTVFDQTKARLPWLLIGIAGGIASATILGGFEGSLGRNPVLALFIPLIGGTGGNVGIQSSALVVQGLANGTLDIKNALQQVFKEAGVAIINSSIISLLVFLYNLFFLDSMAITLAVSLSLLAVVIFASIFGTIVPLTLEKFKIDPALATGPFITITSDIIGVLIYMGICEMLL